jgi:hypothetical protein
MSTQSGTIEITGLHFETLQALLAKAQRAGKSVEEYLRGMIEADLLADQPFSEILEPIRQSFDESGMSEAGLDALFETAREKVYQANASQPQ